MPDDLAVTPMPRLTAADALRSKGCVYAQICERKLRAGDPLPVAHIEDFRAYGYAPAELGDWAAIVAAGEAELAARAERRGAAEESGR